MWAVIVLLAITILLFIIAKRLPDSTWKRIVDVFTIVAAIAAILVFVIPSPTPVQTTPTPSNSDVLNEQTAEQAPVWQPELTQPPTEAPAPTSTTSSGPASTLESTALPSNPTVGSTWLRTTDEMTMLYVPDGTFGMGAFESDELKHQVTLDGFWIDQTEVTNSQFASFLNENGNQEEGGTTWLDLISDDVQIIHIAEEFQPKDGFINFPVVGVSWYGASAYCRWTGGELPTEAQWEYAARGPYNSKYPWGNSPPDNTLLNYALNKGYFTIVGSFLDGASWTGALDMSGNVWEWVNDWYDEDYYAASPVNNPPGPSTGEYKVIRGGGYASTLSQVTTYYRGNLSPNSNPGHVGFRCILMNND